MKRLLTSAALFLCCITTSFAQFSGSGNGTEDDPYLILNPIQLNQLRNFLNQSGVYFKLMADIDLTEFLEDENPIQGWQPVGNSSSAAFKGVLDGNGKTISGLWISRSNTDYVGLFGYCYNATIKNLKIQDADIRGNKYVGVISGYAYYSTTVNTCVLSGKVEGTSYVGGCTGYNQLSGYYENISSSVEVEGGDSTGGIVGYSNGSNGDSSCTISNCFVNSTITGSSKTGGILGGLDNSHGCICNITNCGYVGNITGTSYVGGICGFTYSYSYYNMGKSIYRISNVKNSYAVAFVLGTGENTGGLIGCSDSNVEDCYFSGSVIGQKYTGGLIGYRNSYSVIKCYAQGSVTGTSYVGGLCGYIDDNVSKVTTIESNVIIASSIKATDGYVGRLYGYHDSGNIGSLGTSAENKSYNRTIVINQGVVQDVTDDLQNGTGVSATTLKQKATYVAMGWDFNEVWTIQETECFPYMKRQTAPPVIQSQVVSGATTVSGKCIDGGNITLEVDGNNQQMTGAGNTFSFNVNPLQAGHEVRISAKAEGKEPSYYTTETVSYLGKGTEADPYQVYTASDLTGVYRKGYFKLMNDIDLTDYINQYSPTEGWESIGREGSETIHFDGDGHKITGLWCKSTRNNTGLFSCFANGTIKNLTVEVANGKKVKGGTNTGILIGKMMNGTIENCHVSGSVADGTPVGGMVGLFSGGTISRCQADVTISTTLGTSYVGGLVGEMTSGTIDQCVTTGALTATGAESYVGGLVGKNSGTVSNCYSLTKVTSSYNAAGLVAYNYGVVDMCYATGDLYSNNYAAGVIGYNDGTNAVVSNCAAMNNKIEITYESQQVQQGGGYGQRIIGGIKNNAPAPGMNNYALKTMQVSLNDVPQKVYDDIMNGTAKTNAELKQKATYQELDWDFDNVWKIDEDESYPYQTVKVNGGSDPSNPDDPNSPDDPQGEIEVTDISTMSNVIYIELMEEMNGSQATISLKMKNTAAIRGFQFDLYLPEGVTVVKSTKGKIQGELSAGRLPDEDEHGLTFSEQADGAIRFLCSSQYDETFTGNEGEIATLRVNISEEMADGDYLLQLKNMKLTETDISKYYETELVKCKLTIKTYVLGDINSDGAVDVSDYTGVANHIHGNTPEGFVFRAGDVDESGTIDVSDYTGIANIIHTGSIYGSNGSRALSASRKKANTDISSNDNVIYVEPFVAAPGTQTAISIRMKNAAAIRGFQFDMYLPGGVTAVKSAKGRIQGTLSASRLPAEDEHDLTFSEQADGAIRFLCSSQYDETFTGTDGEIATLTINVAENVVAGDYPIYLRNMKLTETDIARFYEIEEIETTVTITGPSDSRVQLDEGSTVSPVTATNADVRVIRTIAADRWSTICLPFAMTEVQVKTAFGEDVELGDFAGYELLDNGNAIKANFNAATAIAANHPYIIKVKNKVEQFTVDGVDIDPKEEPMVNFGTSRRPKAMVGTYINGTKIGNGCLFLNGNNFWYSTGETKIKGYRAYFDFYDLLPNFEENYAESRIILSFNGEPTGISDIVSQMGEDKVYNLNGQRVRKTGRGVYIINGKKVVKK